MPKKDNSLFTKLTLGAMMADSPAVAQASGWVSKPSGVYMGDPNNEGVKQLRRSLTEIAASTPLIDLGAELAMPYMINGITRLITNVRNAKNFVKSRKILHEYDKLARSVGDWDIFYPHQSKGDIQSLDYFTNPDAIDYAKRIGNKGIIKYTETPTPEITRFPNKTAAQDAIDYAIQQSAKNDALTNADIMKKIASDSKSLKSGNRASLITDGDLSKDSYPLMMQVFMRNQNNGIGQISPVRDYDTYRMMRLNLFGHNPKSLKRIDNSIEQMRNLLKDPDIPGRISIGPINYVPAVEFMKFKNGGLLNRLLTHTNNDIHKALEIVNRAKKLYRE